MTIAVSSSPQLRRADAKPVARPLIMLLALCLLLVGPAQAQQGNSWFGSSGDSEFLPVEQAFPFSEHLDGDALVLTWQVEPGYYLYQERITVESDEPGVTVGELEFDRAGTSKDDPYFGTMDVFYETISVRVPVTLEPPRQEAELRVTFQGCADAGLCYPPETRTVLFMADGASAAGGAPTASVNPDNSGSNSGSEGLSWGSLETAADLVTFLSEADPLWVALAFFVLGLGLTFTPCVLPMIPIVSAIVAGARQITTLQAFGLSLAYVLGMAITYALAGVVTGLLGASFNVQMYLQSPWALGFVAALFVLFALAMFGLFDLQLPAGLRDRLAQQSARLSGGRLASVFGIGALSALIVSPCVSAPLAGALVYIGTTQDALLGGMALLMLGLGMGVPLLIVGTGGRRLMPTPGPWLNLVKGGFGVLMLGIAIWLLERLVAPAFTVALWGLLAVFAGTQLGAFEAARSGIERSRRAAGVSLFSVGLLLLAGALGGAQDPLKPLAPFTAGAGSQSAGPAGTVVEHGGFNRFSDPDELDALVAAAEQPVMFDFYADWCISCKIMERNVFSDPGIQQRLAGYTLLQIDVTENTPAQQALLDEYGLYGPPAILFFSASGDEVESVRVLGEMDRETFDRHLNRVEQALGS